MYRLYNMGGPQCFEGKCKQDNIDLLRFITEGMNSRGIEYWLDFGGLLGVVREGDMIDGDDDMDICATVSEYEKVMEYFDEINEDPDSLYQVEKSTKYRVCGDYSGESLLLYHIRSRFPESNISLLDLFFFEEDGEGGLSSMWTHEDDTFVDTIFPVKKFYVEKWGFSLNIPGKPTTRLIEKYGEDFMTPTAYKTTVMGRLTRGRNVVGRCVRNRYFRKSRRLMIMTLFLLVLFLSLSIIKRVRVKNQL